jgi:hypothetical protein
MSGKPIENNLFDDPDEAGMEKPVPAMSDDTLAKYGMVILSKKESDILELQRQTEETAGKG